MEIKKLFESIDNHKDKFTDFWRDICSIESKSGDKAALDTVAYRVQDFAEALGFTVRRQSFLNTGDFLAVDMNAGCEKGYVFLAHMDTVHEKGAFGYPCVKIDGDRMYGPGVIDCKGGIAVAMLAMKALYENGYTKNTRLILTSDEEVSNTFGGEDGITFIKENAVGFCGAFNCEVGVDGEVLVARKGILRVRITVNGKSSHSGISYFDGVSAVREAAHKIIALESKSTVGGTTYNCAIINGGKAANIVPDRCEIVVDIRVRTNEDMKKAWDAVNAVALHSFVDGTYSSVEVISRRAPMIRTPENEQLYKELADISDKYGLERLAAAESGGGSDSAYTQMAGVPTLCGLGTTGEFCHTNREYARIESLCDRAKLLAAFCYSRKSGYSSIS